MFIDFLLEGERIEKKPKISVVIPARNEEDVIERSVRSLLNQTAKPYEIIVVNDGSTDATRGIVEKLGKEDGRVKLINFDRGHSAAFARNRGAEAARGDVVYFQDSDIVVDDRGLIEKVGEVFQDESIGAVLTGGGGEYKTFLQKCQEVRAVMSNLFFKASGRKIEYISGIRRKLFSELGGFNEKIFYYEDRELGRRVAERTRIPFVKVGIRHIEPSTLSEIVRQARYVGKGASTYNLVKENPLVLLYPPYPFFWLLFATCVMLSFLSSIFAYVVAFMFMVLIVEAVVAYFLTGMLLPSICFVFFISPLRAFLISYSFLLDKLNSLR